MHQTKYNYTQNTKFDKLLSLYLAILECYLAIYFPCFMLLIEIQCRFSKVATKLWVGQDTFLPRNPNWNSIVHKDDPKSSMWSCQADAGWFESELISRTLPIAFNHVLRFNNVVRDVHPSLCRDCTQLCTVCVRF